MRLFLIIIMLLAMQLGQSQSSTIQHVIVLGIDGCSPDGITKAHTPHIDSLIAQGSYTYEAQAQIPTVSSPNWASIIDGVPPSAHGIWSNDWKRKDIRDSSYCGGKRGEVSPTIFKVVRRRYRHAQICCLTEWWGFRRLVDRHQCSLLQRTLWEGNTDIRAPTVISVRKPKLLFIHFNNVDEAGHKYGHGTSEYYKALERVDVSIGKIIRAVKRAGILETTVFVIIADHGGIGKGHGGTTPQEVNVPLVFSGAGIKRGHHITGMVNNYDCPATIAAMLQAPTPSCWQGKVLTQIFK